MPPKAEAVGEKIKCSSKTATFRCQILKTAASKITNPRPVPGIRDASKQGVMNRVVEV
jgi:hypothetical protein